MPRLEKGLAVLDVGCGPGTITAELAELVAPGTVIGLDVAAEVIALADAEFGGEERPNLAFEVGDVYHLDFADGTFDVVYAHQVLQHLSDPVAALEEIRRVLVPGGTVAVRDADYSAFRWAPPSEALDRWMVLFQAVTRHNGANPDAGASLATWVAAAGFTDVVATDSVWIYESESERRWWGELWAERAVASAFAVQAVEFGLATPSDLEEIAAGFLRWASEPTGRFVLPNGEVLARR